MQQSLNFASRHVWVCFFNARGDLVPDCDQKNFHKVAVRLWRCVRLSLNQLQFNLVLKRHKCSYSVVIAFHQILFDLDRVLDIKIRLDLLIWKPLNFSMKFGNFVLRKKTETRKNNYNERERLTREGWALKSGCGSMISEGLCSRSSKPSPAQCTSGMKECRERLPSKERQAQAHLERVLITHPWPCA